MYIEEYEMLKTIEETPKEVLLGKNLINNLNRTLIEIHGMYI